MHACVILIYHIEVKMDFLMGNPFSSPVGQLIRECIIFVSVVTLKQTNKKHIELPASELSLYRN